MMPRVSASKTLRELEFSDFLEAELSEFVHAHRGGPEIIGGPGGRGGEEGREAQRGGLLLVGEDAYPHRDPDHKAYAQIKATQSVRGFFATFILV
jgi:hypothetical protein